MNKKEFLYALCEKLKEEQSADQIEEHVRYYNDYINQEVKSGKTEEEVIDSLGDPTLLARSIMETPDSTRQYHEEIIHENPDGGGYQEETTSQGKGMPFQIRAANGWGCLVVAIIAMLVLGVVLWLFGAVVKVFAPVLVPVLVVLFVITIMKRKN